ncbi:hypothetical protein CEE45_06175 [Candidatus Heimdallarchaeota archaeon B3_Heim]|nr:MAG: hypothetical protein CEE45_06175 [Candidatus Heimdallarchaeota archaeon B3_Heim]
MAEIRDTLHIAPIMRFVVEFSTWIWLLLLGIESIGISLLSSHDRKIFPSWVYLILLGLSLFLLSQFNFPGDKKPHGKMVQGWQRILVEIFSATLGIFAAWVIFGLFGAILQAMISILSFFLDRERWKWFLGIRKEPPIFVLALGNYPPR